MGVPPTPGLWTLCGKMLDYAEISTIKAEDLSNVQDVPKKQITRTPRILALYRRNIIPVANFDIFDLFLTFIDRYFFISHGFSPLNFA